MTDASPRTAGRTRLLERAGLAGLLLLLGLACGTMMAESAWTGAPGIDAVPEPGDGLAGTAMMLFYTLQAAIGGSVLFMRRIRLFPTFLAGLAAAPTVFLYVRLVGASGFAAPAVQVDEFARVIVAGVAGILLLAPWILRRLPWPARSPGHLGIGIAICSGAALQVVFHQVLVIPGSEISFRQFHRARAVVERTETPGELARLADIGALDLRAVPSGTEREAFEAADIVDTESLAGSVARIREEAPRVLHSWTAPGQSKIDRNLIIWDGRGGRARIWLMPTDGFLLPRLTAISAYYYLTGLSGFVWMAGALLVHAGHARRRGRR